MYYCHLKTPIGELLLAGKNDVLYLLGFPEGPMGHAPEADWTCDEKPFLAAREQLLEYFAGTRKVFDLPIRLDGTDFQVRVLEELQKIPYGATTSYAAIAERIGNPRAVRAVGSANHRNPIPIIVPCHRVIGRNGDLRGFGGGTAMKRALLALEAKHAGNLTAGGEPGVTWKQSHIMLP